MPNNLASPELLETERKIELKILWGQTVIDAIARTTEPTITIGDEQRVVGVGPLERLGCCDLELPSRCLPTKSYVIAEHAGGDGAAYLIHLPPGGTGRLELADGTIIGLDEIYRGGRGAEQGEHRGAVQYLLRAAETLYLSLDTITLQIRYVEATPLPAPGFWAEVSYNWVNILALAAFLHATAIVAFELAPPHSTMSSEDLYTHQTIFVHTVLIATKSKPTPSLLGRLHGSPSDARHRGPEGQAGHRSPPDHDPGRMAARGDPDKELAARALSDLFGAGDRRSLLSGNGRLGGELQAALGAVAGAEVADASGLNGLGTRGDGPGANGLSATGVGVGTLHTKGRGPGGHGDDDYGDGSTSLGPHRDREIGPIQLGPPTIVGALDKEIIRAVIKQHLNQIRYCYEKELSRSPGLYGKVATRFVIGGQGLVEAAIVTESTLKSDEVERCITGKIVRWEFPRPKGGGKVIVKYPFVFKTSG